MGWIYRALGVKFKPLAEELFDVVVLSVGMVPRQESMETAKVLGINTGPSGFFTAQPSDSIKTNVKGIFLAGSCQGPMDINNSIAQGTAAAKMVVEALA